MKTAQNNATLLEAVAWREKAAERAMVNPSGCSGPLGITARAWTQPPEAVPP